jgi:hypothetical protein
MTFIPFPVSVARPVEASGLLEAGQRPAIRMQFKSNAENSRSNNLHPDRLVSLVYVMRPGYNLDVHSHVYML